MLPEISITFQQKQLSTLLLMQAMLVLLSFSTVIAQRVAPGVPPQHYQQPHPQQFQQQPPPQQVHHAPNAAPQQYQQVQYQQVPVQQPPQPQFQQQQQQQQQHPQHVPHQANGQQQLLNPANIDNERAHIQEHVRVPIDTNKMTEKELQFHYFKMHDSDNNNQLDGCELIKSLIHWHEQGSKESQHNEQAPHVEEKIFSDDELAALIDPILQVDDTSRDGYIDYPEFIKAQQKAAASQQKQQQQQQPQAGH